ncbi:MAG: hypothetical protein JWQ63_1974 [Mucilaginibacter sp.]|nr:hypothetical protein [Mucilaginibacter sp.]
MINQIERITTITGLEKKHPDFPVMKYINISNDGEITFKPGIIPNMEVWEDFRDALAIKYSPCSDTYPKQN